MAMESMHGVPGGVPLLGQHKQPERIRISVAASALPRHIDADGVAWEGKPNDPAIRGSYYDGEQLLGAIQGLVRHELRAALTKAGLRPPSEEVSAADYLTPCSVPSCGRPQAAGFALGLGDPPDQMMVVVPLCQGHVGALQAQARPVEEATA